MSKNTIPIKEAKTWAKDYQHKGLTGAKAFLIPVIDLIEALEEMGVIKKETDGHYSLNNVNEAGVRAYMAVDPKISVANGEKLLIVGTRIDCNGVHRDIIEGEKSSGCKDGEIDAHVSALVNSGVYDFTEPCPNVCDQNSPLF